MKPATTNIFYRITVAYDGTDFHGWQVQPTAVTVASCLQHTFAKVFGTTITLVGASRTDAGVHAQGQVARFATTLTMPPERLLKAWNAQLPDAVRVQTIEQVDAAFHPCRNVRQKTYTYTLFTQPPLPHEARYGWHYSFMHLVDLKKFEQLLGLYQGTHDFGSFCKIEDDFVTSVRTIDAIWLEQTAPHKLVVTIQGQGFARFQIRRMIGYALDLARQPGRGSADLMHILQNPNPKQNLVKADGKGLCLVRIEYHETDAPAIFE